MRVPRRLFELHAITDPAHTRYALGGVLLHRHHGKIFLEASDGATGIVVEYDDSDADLQIEGVDESPKEGFETIVPAEDCKRILKLGGDWRRAARVCPRFEHVIVDESTGQGGRKLLIAGADLQITETLRSEPIKGRFPSTALRQYVRPDPDAKVLAVDLVRLADAINLLVKMAKSQLEPGHGGRAAKAGLLAALEITDGMLRIWLKDADGTKFAAVMAGLQGVEVERWRAVEESEIAGESVLESPKAKRGFGAATARMVRRTGTHACDDR